MTGWLRDALLHAYDWFWLNVWLGPVKPHMLPRIAARDLARRKRWAISEFSGKISRAAKDGETSLTVRTWPYGDDTVDAVAEAFAQRGYRIETVTWAVGAGESRREFYSKVVHWDQACDGCKND